MTWLKSIGNERLNNTGTLFLNSHFGSYLIKELNKLPLINVDEEHVKTLNTTFLISKLAGYSSFQKYSIYLIISIFAFMIFTYLLKLFTGLFLNTLNYLTSWYKAAKKAWKLIFPKKEDNIIEKNIVETNYNEYKEYLEDADNISIEILKEKKL